MRRQGAPRAVAPHVPMGANAGAPGDTVMQKAIVRETLLAMTEMDMPGIIKPLPYEYHAVL